MPEFAVWKTALLLTTVLAVFVQTSHGQAYVYALSHHNTQQQQQQQFFIKDTSSELDLSTSNHTSEQEIANNSTVYIIETTIHDKSNDLSQTAMDVITIVWYVATFLALAAFFMLMACSERRCSQARLAAAANSNNNNSDRPAAPPTPSPSYSNFAPPSYDTVMKTREANKASIFVIPFTHPNGQKDDNNIGVESQPHTPATTPPVTFYTIDELQKFSS